MAIRPRLPSENPDSDSDQELEPTQPAPSGIMAATSTALPVFDDMPGDYEAIAGSDPFDPREELRGLMTKAQRKRRELKIKEPGTIHFMHPASDGRHVMVVADGLGSAYVVEFGFPSPDHAVTERPPKHCITLDEAMKTAEGWLGSPLPTKTEIVWTYHARPAYLFARLIRALFSW